ncbi:MAG: DUF1127 domain-containing protein [Deltaproteobacteria bacterium]|nr:DUF1127 domain-containing protein [Deltaproteobacteria bacterium]MBT4528020.1 DUF1127 domain-containing protein [Deltaproteobacteria bacterium]
MKQPVLVGLKPINVAKIAKNVLNTLSSWRERAQQRRLLLTLDNRMLQDIGISRTEAICESNKSVWEK